MKRGTPKFRLKSCEAAVKGIRTRMPFRYGRATLTAVPLLLVRVRIEASGKKSAVGLSSDCLPPRWFQKDSAWTYHQEIDSQVAAFQKAREVYLEEGKSLHTVSDLWDAAYPRVVEEGAALGCNALTASFGSSFVERAVIDALCRLRGASFFEALQQDLLGIKTSRDLPEGPVTSFFCRHTVGLSDPLMVNEIPEDERIDDSLPQALEEDIELYGLRYFKIKLAGEDERDLDRLSRMAVLLNQRCRHGYQVTLDGNEQFTELGRLESLIEALRARPYGDQFVDSVLYVEQPLPREVALDPAVAGDVARLSELKPVIIDESDDAPGAFERAVKLGYSGVAHKNCKGVIKSLRNRSLVLTLNDDASTLRYFQTGEDLVNVPIVALQQDLAVLAALGVAHAERNGHHYFRGLDHLPEDETTAALSAHPDLYEQRGPSAFLRIEDGVIQAHSIQAPGFGYSCDIAFDDRRPLEDWKFEELGFEERSEPVDPTG